MNPLVSIIVPVYNVEQYLPKCIESIINQTLSNIEVILVNDGSKDSSGEIINEYAKKDKRIIPIHKQNGGQGSARNEGLKIAKGQYVGFVDSDDWIDANMYEALVSEALKEDSDLVVCGRKGYDDFGKKHYDINLEKELINIDMNTVPDYLIDRLFFKHTFSACNKLYRNDLLKINNIFFGDVNEVGSEDALFNYCYLLCIKKISSIKGTFYNQFIRSGSTTREYRVGAMKRTANLLNNIKLYSDAMGYDKVAFRVMPLMLLFFQQWNYNLLKSYSSNFYKDFKLEHQSISSDKLFKSIERQLVFNQSLNIYYKRLGYRIYGTIYMKIYLCLSYFNLTSLATLIRKIY